MQLRHLADDLRNELDREGKYREAAYRDRIRDMRLRDNPDGSGHLDAELTAETAERLRVAFDALTKPRPAQDGTPDQRDRRPTTLTGQAGHLDLRGPAVPADLAKRWAGPEARDIAVLLSKMRGIEAYSTVQRIFTEQQRLAMIARDGGCSFPHCDACAAWTDAHHTTDWKDTPTEPASTTARSSAAKITTRSRRWASPPS